jgi:pyridinium-3,5-biscarboxylic acid mononucleotide sulfurtransferase
MVSSSSTRRLSFFLMQTSDGGDRLEKKYEALSEALKNYSQRLAVAFSGGVDSTLLLYTAREVLGKENVVVLWGLSELVSLSERNSGEKVLKAMGVTAVERLEIALHPLLWPEFTANTADRCYFCKRRMYDTFLSEMEKVGCTALLDGTNADDLKDRRPGLRAIHELSVKTPLLDAGLNKDEIRILARQFQLLSHDKPSNSCLATRLSKGTAVNKEGLRLVEKCEDFLLSRNFIGCRVRPKGNDVILELTDKDMERLALSPERVEVIHFMQSAGFGRVLVDMKPRAEC